MEADCSKRVARAYLRKTAPVVQNYSVGDLVCFRRYQEVQYDDKGWSVASRVYRI